jgi:tetratricopeptide (TPR) repeat protein
MKKLNYLLLLIIFIFGVGCSEEKATSKLPNSKESKDVMVSLPEGPLTLAAESDAEANTHNEEGILHYKEGHFDIALKHFREAGKAQSEVGEIHFNEALALDKLGDHGSASEHFKMAQANAKGNTLILESKILLAHIQ